jgi:lipoyl(octanoyl) transferase
VIQSLYLGRVTYADALCMQQELVALRTDKRIGNVLLLLEHPPVLTLGRNADHSNILASRELLEARGVTVHEINRGGDVTFHGPGQLVGYPIFDLRSLRNGSGGRLGPVDFVRRMEESLMRVCGTFGVKAGRIRGLTGVWCGVDDANGRCVTAQDPPCGERKIAAIGIHVARGVTSHGFAFNIATELDYFTLINPCGITDRPVTSLEKEVAGARPLPGLEEIAHRTAREFGAVFGDEVGFVESLDALRAQAASDKAREFPAEDTPLQVPADIERLRGAKDRPVSA